MSSTPTSDPEQPEDSTFTRIHEMRERYEPLRADLHKYLEESRDGYFIRHRFCTMAVPDLERCALIHHKIDERIAEADACFEVGDWAGWIRCHAISSQPEWFAKDADVLPNDQYWELLAGVYQQQKFTHHYRDLFDACFRSQRHGRENLMEPEERTILARFPEHVTVYRGFWDEEDFEDGNAWTLDRRAAVWYANWCWTKDQGDPALAEGIVAREDILAFWKDDTVIVPRGKVRAIKCRRARCKKARVRWNEYVTPPFDIEAFLGNR